jgi:C4-dicarboxylate-specific signal transduction histidine kinase
MASLGHVATGIAHEIRNPLSGVNIYVSTLHKMYEHTQGLEKTRQILDKIQSASEKIESVIKRVMDFSKPSEPEFAMTNINKPIEEAIELASVALRKSGVAITKSLAADLPLCNADHHMIEQVILNLITNAAEAMKNFEAEKQVLVSSSAQDGLIRVTVADSGPGVPEEERAKIFDPFFTTKNGNPGIGLSLSHRIITDHGGTMRVSTSKWGGAEFMIEIPLDRSVA